MLNICLFRRYWSISNRSLERPCSKDRLKSDPERMEEARLVLVSRVPPIKQDYSSRRSISFFFSKDFCSCSCTWFDFCSFSMSSCSLSSKLFIKSTFQLFFRFSNPIRRLYSSIYSWFRYFLYLTTLNLPACFMLVTCSTISCF